MTKIAESLVLSYVVPHCLVGTPGGARCGARRIAGDDADGGRIANGAVRRSQNEVRRPVAEIVSHTPWFTQCVSRLASRLP